jgi:hypothetical protein
MTKKKKTKKSDYLSRLPEHAQRRGDASEGEAELVTKRTELERIQSECADELSGSALGKGGKTIGILIEDEVRMIARDAVRYPSGETKCQMRMIGTTEFDGVNGVVVLRRIEGKFVLRRIFRHATRAWELEAVRGRRETGQTSMQAAEAEIKQELGFPLEKLYPLGQVCPDTAFMSSVLDLFLADLGAGPRDDDPEPTEAFGEIVHLTAEELGHRILKGEVRDSYTITAMTFAQLRGLVPPVSAVSGSPVE